MTKVTNVTACIIIETLQALLENTTHSPRVFNILKILCIQRVKKTSVPSSIEMYIIALLTKKCKKNVVL